MVSYIAYHLKIEENVKKILFWLPWQHIFLELKVEILKYPDNVLPFFIESKCKKRTLLEILQI